jgi:hypothetical protein
MPTIIFSAEFGDLKNLLAFYFLPRRAQIKHPPADDAAQNNHGDHSENYYQRQDYPELVVCYL